MKAFSYDHRRTPLGWGKLGGRLHKVTPCWLASLPLVAPEIEQGGNMVRMVILQSDYAQSVPALQLNRNCGSGLEAVVKAMDGQDEITIGGGVDMMSLVPLGSADPLAHDEISRTVSVNLCGAWRPSRAPTRACHSPSWRAERRFTSRELP